MSIESDVILQELRRLYVADRVKYLERPEEDLNDDEMEMRLFWESVEGYFSAGAQVKEQRNLKKYIEVVSKKTATMLGRIVRLERDLRNLETSRGQEVRDQLRALIGDEDHDDR